MVGGELPTKITIWLAVAGYAAATAAFALSRGRHGWDGAARLAWTVACAALLAHVACAFHFYHGWSHWSAYLDTARQTNEVVGLDWGGGLYINYALVAGWVLDVTWWRLGGLGSYRRRWRPLTAASHGFLLFIFFNATVFFKSGPARWAGLVVCLGLCVAWWLAARERLNRYAGAVRGPGQSALSVVSITVVGKWFVRRLNAAMAVYTIALSVGFMAAFPAVGAAVTA